jgi:hypothetical protein
MLHCPTQGINHLLRAGQVKGNHVDDNIRLQRRNTVAKGTGLFFSPAIKQNALHLTPGRMPTVWRGSTTTDIDNLMSALNQKRD